MLLQANQNNNENLKRKLKKHSCVFDVCGSGM
jgi:hypothetical protein